jgi:hypothetical protein
MSPAIARLIRNRWWRGTGSGVIIIPESTFLPRTAEPPAGTSWNPISGKLDGSIFNTHPGAVPWHNYSRPAISGTTYSITSIAQWNSARAELTQAVGGIVGGDCLRLADGLVLPREAMPKRPSFDPNAPDCVRIEWEAEPQLPTYSNTSWLAKDRVDPSVHMADMPLFRSTTATESPMEFLRSSGGYWFSGIMFDYINATAMTSRLVQISDNTTGGPTQLSHLPRFIVIDRCIVRYTGPRGNLGVTSGPFNQVGGVHMNGTYLAVLHSHVGQFYAEGSDCQAISATTSQGPWAVLGNYLSGWSQNMLIGGSDPSIPHLVPEHIDMRYNECEQPIELYPDAVPLTPNGTRPPHNNNKAGVELKTGKHVVMAFNDCRGAYYEGSYPYYVTIKAADQSGGSLYQAECRHVLWWCNRYAEKMGKGAFQVLDVFSSKPGAGVGCSFIEAGMNFHLFTPVQWNPPYAPVPTSVHDAFNFSKSQGDGVDTMDIWRMTVGCMANFADLGSANAQGGAGWNNISMEDIIGVDAPQTGPIVSGSLQDFAALNAAFGAGKWNFRRVHILPGKSTWDVTLAGSPYACGYLQTVSNFVDLAGFNPTLVDAHPLQGTALTGGDPGVDVTFLNYHLAGVRR